MDHAHRWLDEAVFAAYGWPADLSEDETRRGARRRALNWERAAAQGAVEPATVGESTGEDGPEA